MPRKLSTSSVTTNNASVASFQPTSEWGNKLKSASAPLATEMAIVST